MKILKDIFPCCLVGLMIGFAICGVIAFKKELNVAGSLMLLGSIFMAVFSADAILQEDGE